MSTKRQGTVHKLCCLGAGEGGVAPMTKSTLLNKKDNKGWGEGVKNAEIDPQLLSVRKISE